MYNYRIMYKYEGCLHDECHPMDDIGEAIDYAIWLYDTNSELLTNTFVVNDATGEIEFDMQAMIELCNE